MANLYEILTEEDRKKIEWYIHEFAGFGGGYTDMTANLKYILRYWDDSKEVLYKMLGNNLTISRHVNYNRSMEDMEDDFREYFTNWNAPGKPFREAFLNEIGELTRKNIMTSSQYFDLNSMMYCEELFGNIYNGDSFKLSYEGKTLMINHGMKIGKLLGKLCDILNLDRNEYEKFRIIHSQFLNQKTISGELCLTIHPLDFMTMSDNNCGWNSCMRWQEGGGEYRQGTVEMMNSPIVLEAYLKSNEDMEFYRRGGESMTWNSKRWRELFIVSDKLLLGIKGYPYENEDLEGICLSWIKKLAEKNLGYGPYTKYLNKIQNNCYNNIAELNVNSKVYFQIDTNFMYNDVYSNHNAYVSTKIDLNEEFTGSVELNYSGECECMCCGEPLEDYLLDDRENTADQLVCANCSGAVKCDKCGDIVDVDRTYDVNGLTYCEYCYDESTTTCPCCGVRKDLDDMDLIRLRFKKKPSGLYKDICYQCCRNGSVKVFFTGEIEKEERMWDVNYYVDGETLTEEGKEAFGISEDDYKSWLEGQNPNQKYLF